MRICYKRRLYFNSDIQNKTLQQNNGFVKEKNCFGSSGPRLANLSGLCPGVLLKKKEKENPRRGRAGGSQSPASKGRRRQQRVGRPSESQKPSPDSGRRPLFRGSCSDLGSPSGETVRLKFSPAVFPAGGLTMGPHPLAWGGPQQ